MIQEFRIVVDGDQSAKPLAIVRECLGTGGTQKYQDIVFDLIEQREIGFRKDKSLVGRTNRALFFLKTSVNSSTFLKP